MVGTSEKIYNQILELCMVKYRDSETLYLGAKVGGLCLFYWKGSPLYSTFHPYVTSIHPLCHSDPQELSYCTLRSQLLMAIHDDSCSVASRDGCHELAWTLDAGIMNGSLTMKHLVKLEKFFTDVSDRHQTVE